MFNYKTSNERVGDMTLLLSGTPLANWQNVLSELPEGHSWDDEAFKTALKSLKQKLTKTTSSILMIFQMSLNAWMNFQKSRSLWKTLAWR
jgi:hypothetical protein